MIKCIAVDDEILSLGILKKFALQIPELNLCETFTDAIEAREYLMKNEIDLLFLDIQMPDINGFELIENLSCQQPLIIFTTAFKDYALEGFEINAVDYLLKPFGQARFQKAVTRAIERLQALPEPIDTTCLYLHVNYKLVKIPYNEIIYIESLDDYLKVYTSSKEFVVRMPLKVVVEKLPKDKFIRIHRSYIISIAKITFIQFRRVGLENKIELPIGETFRSVLNTLKGAS